MKISDNVAKGMLNYHIWKLFVLSLNIHLPLSLALF